MTDTPGTKNYRNYVLAMLTIVYIFNFVDRQLLVILQESIKEDLRLSDTQLGLLTGFTFAIFYATLGIPIARLADRWNRRNIVAISLIVWSAMTAISGTVQNFVQLLLARIGVGVGEAGGSPPAHAIISDYFPPNKRAKAFSIYSTGIYLGVLLGFLAGGYLNGELGWRNSFFLIGIPGILFAVLLLATVREPIRGAMDRGREATASITLGQVAKTLFSLKSFTWLALATGFHAFTTYALGNWMPSILFRMHDLTSAQVGLSLGLIMGLGGAAGTLTGGYLAGRLGTANPKWYMWIPALGAVVAMPGALLAIFSDNTTIALIGLALANLANACFLPPAIAITHNLVPTHMRAFSSAVLFFVLNLIGLGLGPLTVGIISDILEPTFGIEGLRWAMMVTFVTVIIAIGMYFSASRHVKADLHRPE